MEIKLTPQESETYFHNALCNGLGTVESGYGLELTFKMADYEAARKKLKEAKANICIEDVLLEILRMGNKLKMIDHEGNGAYTAEITLSDVHERVQKTQLNHLTDMIEENDDAVTADVILQRVFFDDLIFG